MTLSKVLMKSVRVELRAVPLLDHVCHVPFGAETQRAHRRLGGRVKTPGVGKRAGHEANNTKVNKITLFTHSLCRPIDSIGRN